MDINSSLKKNNTKLWYIILFSSVSLYFLLTLFLSLSYHWGYLSALTDLGTFDQAIWSTLNGDFFLNTNVFNKPLNYFGIHFRPILILFCPLYYFSYRPEWLILAQSIALSITAFPIFFTAKHIFKSNFIGFSWAMIFLLNPFILNTHPWVFRPETLAVPFIALALWAIEKRNFILLLLSCLLILSCKEHFGLTISGLGILWGIKNKDLKKSIIIFFLGILYSCLILKFVMPILSPTGNHVMLSNELGQLSRYGWLGNSFREIFQSFLYHPLFVLRELYRIGSFHYILLLLTVFLFFPLVGIEFFLAMSSDLIANTLSTNPMPRSLIAYHSVTLIPLLTVAAIYGVQRVSRFFKKFSAKELTMFVLFTNIALGYYLSPIPLPGSLNYWSPVKFINFPDLTLQKIKKNIDNTYSISVQSNIGAHFSQRKEVYLFPNKIEKVDCIILRLSSPTNNIDVNNKPVNLARHTIGMLDAHLQMNRKEYLNSIKKLLQSKDFQISFWSDPWLIFKRGLSKKEPIFYEQIENKLKQLHIEWQVGK